MSLNCLVGNAMTVLLEEIGRLIPSCKSPIERITLTQLVFTYSKLTTETLEQGVKYAKS